MSRIGRLPVKIPQGVTVSLGGEAFEAKGPRGSAQVPLPKVIEVAQEEDAVVVRRHGDSREARSLHGLIRKSIHNAVTGVSEGFTRVLEINGVGYRADVKGQVIHFNLGYSHPILFQLPEGVTAKVERQVLLTIEGSDRQVVGSIAAQIRELRPPEPYKGKGIKYAEERIRRKSGKAAGAA